MADLVEGDLAEHWRATAAFLAVAVEAWPRRLAELGLVDPAARRVRLLRRLAEAWDERPPTLPVIAAGSTGTAPAAAGVLGAVAARAAGLRGAAGAGPRPGPDGVGPVADDDGEQHPQGALKRLLGAARDRPGRGAALARAGHGRERARAGRGGG